MKILVMSDNHGDRMIVEKIVNEFNEKVDLICHCGDSEFSIDDLLNNQLHIVKGNMDGNFFDDYQTVKLGDKNVVITHGHNENVNQGLLNLELLAKALDANVVLFGHTHQLQVLMDDNILFLNPGSISQPRGIYQSLNGTFAIIEFNNENYHVQYYNRNLKPIEELQFDFKVM